MRATRQSRQKLFEVVELTLGVAPGTVDGSSAPETLPQWDSLNHLNLVMAIESEFGVALAPQDVLDMRSVELMETILRDHGVELS
ncbi:MAG: acyl carrier protein [Vicinamibacterales bacterium]